MIEFKQFLKYMGRLEWVKAKISITEAEIESGYEYEMGFATRNYVQTKRKLDEEKLKGRKHQLNMYYTELKMLEKKEDKEEVVCNDPLPF